MGDSDDLNPLPSVTVIVVSYNTVDHLRRCLDSLEPDRRTIVIDNASTDGSPEMVRREFPHVELVPLDCNVGFGAANNLGLDRADTELVLLLNSDAEALPGSIDRLARLFREREDAVAAGGRLVYPDGRLQQSSAGPLTLWAVFCEQLFLERALAVIGLPRYWNSVESGGVTRVAQVTGACLMMRPKERFDPDYFLYCEDTDLCRRLASHGVILYCPDAVFRHALGASSPALSRWVSVARYNAGKERYFRKHHGKVAGAVCFLFNRLGALLRLIIAAIATLLTLGLVSELRTRSAIFWRVLTAPLLGPEKPGCTDQATHPDRPVPQ